MNLLSCWPTTSTNLPCFSPYPWKPTAAQHPTARVPGLSSLWSKEQQVVCVCVLLRCAYGMPKECRTYAKVSLGAGKSCRTHYITGVRELWTSLCIVAQGQVTWRAT